MEKNSQIIGILKEILKEQGKTNGDIDNFISKSKKEKSSFFHYCLENEIIKSEEVLDFFRDICDNSFFDATNKKASIIPDIESLNSEIYEKYDFIPLSYNGISIQIATSNPLNDNLNKELRTLLNFSSIEVFIADYFEIKRLIKEFKESNINSSDFDMDELNEMDISYQTEDDNEDDAMGLKADSPVVNFVNQMLLDSVKKGASDLHFEPYEHSYRVRFRIDGVLKEISHPNTKTKGHIAARLKVMSGMNIAEKRKPQDGRISIKYHGKAIDFRVNTLPTLFGEKIVLRILDPSSAQMGIDALGYEDDQKSLYLDALSKPQGMILVTGPTGSGKTVSLYTGLNILNTPDINISTAEDPVEINLEGINQVNINNKSGMDFATALRSFLRQDPDVIMVGEIRDLETAEIAIKAAQTGHMVMSTLHTNSAAETLTRLKNMGVPSYNIASSVNLIIAQRLVRRLCPHCKKKLELNEKVLKELGFTEQDFKDGIQLHEANKDGCENCSSGFKGRCGVYEVVKIDKEFSELIFNDADSMTISNAFRNSGYNDLRRSALLKVKAGLTTLEEVSRVTIE